jgi:hypothetical protein
MAFAKLKALLRVAAARTIPDLWQAIADALRRFTPQECANYLAAAGYDATCVEIALAAENGRPIPTTAQPINLPTRRRFSSADL